MVSVLESGQRKSASQLHEPGARRMLEEYDEAGAQSPSNGAGGSDVECDEALGAHLLPEQGCWLLVDNGFHRLC